MKSLLDYIRSLTDFSNDSWLLLQQAITQVEYRKHEHLLKEGEVSNTLFFIEKGYCRSYYVMDGIEKNTNFYFENEIAANINSFGGEEKSKFNIIASEPLTAILIDKSKLIFIAQESSELERMGRHFIRAFASKQHEMSEIFKLYAAEGRLDYIEERYPEMIQRIPLSQLSSFLGVTRETLSRIRKRRTKD